MKKKKIVSRLLWTLFGVACLTLLGANIYLPQKYVIESPGPVASLDPFVSIEGKEDDFKGSFNITTVSQRDANLATYILAKVTPFEEIVAKKDLLGDTSQEEYEEMNKFYMVSAQNAAKAEALKLADQSYSTKFLGVHVMSVMKESTFNGKIKVGDTVTEVNEKTFKSSTEFITYVKSLKIGDRVKVGYERDGGKETAEGKLIEIPETKSAGIGISLVDSTEVVSDIPITFNAYGISGPSGGLMLTLETYTKLTGKDIRHGQKIAGTGTMDFSGNVGRIGGIDKKVASASKNGATIFFAPDDEIPNEIKKEYSDLKSNYEEALEAAKKINTKMKIIPVKTAEDALDYLEKMKK